MANPLVGISFMQLGQQGWSEVYPLISTDYVAGMADLVNIVTTRMNLACNDCINIGMRISDPTIKGDSLTHDGLGAGTYGFGPPVVFSNTPNLALRIRANSGVVKRGIRYLHAVPTDQMLGPTYEPTPGFQAAVLAYCAILVTKVAILTKNTILIPPTFTFNPITSATPDDVWTRKVGRPFGLHRGRRRIAVHP